jgi:hypothetical protein
MCGTAGDHKQGYKFYLKSLFQSGNKIKFEIFFPKGRVPLITISNLACSYVLFHFSDLKLSNSGLKGLV